LRTVVVGAGRAGCRIAHELARRLRIEAVLLDTDELTLRALQHRHSLLVGDRLLDGNGTGRDLSMGRDAFDGDRYRVVEVIDRVKKVFDCLVVVSAYGGGTGGAADVLIDELKRSYSEPVYHLGILPDEDAEPRVLANFAQSFRRIAEVSDAVFPVDVASLSRGRVQTQLNAVNRRVVECFSRLLRVGEYSSPEELGSRVLGARDVINTLSGVSTLGFAARELGKDAPTPELVVELTKQASSSPVLPCRVESASRALVVVYGPRKYTDFVGSIPARLWIEENVCAEVRGGDVPVRGAERVEVMVVYSGIAESERLRYLYTLAKGAAEGRLQAAKLGERLRLLEAKAEEVASLAKGLHSLLEEVESGGRRKD